MFTLFFAGRDFAPKLLVQGQNIQDFLQGHFIAAMARCDACRLAAPAASPPLPPRCPSLPFLRPKS